MNTIANKKDGSIFWGSFWMLLLSILLFWLPGLGSLVAGIVGGKVAGSVGAALMAAVLPSLILGIALFLGATLLTGLPVIGIVFGLGGALVAITGIGILLLGALIGGLMA